jgi:DNA-directed RNA polymerase specialized sigma24 family protein
MTDTALIKQFKKDPESGYASLLDHYTPVILRMIRRFLTDPDEVMETYTSICERLRNNNYQALRRFRVNSELTPWLSVVVANACRDRFRKNRVTSVPKSVISKLDDREQMIFKFYYQEHMRHQEIADTINGQHGLPCTLLDVGRAIQKIDDMLSVNKRWHLLAALRANRPVLSLEDLALAGMTPPDRSRRRADEDPEESSEKVNELNSAIGELDAEDQLLILLRFEHGMRANQIAKVMQFENPKYVYTRLRTIINRLRRDMVSDRVVG